jgi:hypothetical protein
MNLAVSFGRFPDNFIVCLVYRFLIKKNYYPSYKIFFIAFNLPQGHVDQPVVSMESLYLENAVCVFTRKSCEEAALGIGLSFTKDLRYARAQK